MSAATERRAEEWIIPVLRAEMDAQGLSVADLASRMGQSVENLDNVFAQREELYVDVFGRVCDALGLKMHEVVEKAEGVSR